MVSKRVAARILPFCEEGPVLDLLAEKSSSFTGNAAPSDDVARRLLRGASVEETEKIVAVLTSPDLILEVVRKDKRIKVKRALAENEHLPEEAVNLLAQDAIQRLDGRLAKSLIQNLEPLKALSLLDRVEGISRLLNLQEEVTGLVQSWCYSESAEKVFRRATELFPQYTQALVHKATQFDPKIGRGAVLDAVVAAGDETWSTTYRGDRTRTQIAGYLVNKEATPEEVRRALRALPWTELRMQVLSHHRHQLPVTQEELFENLYDTAEAVGQVAVSLSSHGHPLTRDSAEILNEYSLPIEVHQKIRCTPEGAEVFLQSSDMGVVAAHVAALSKPSQALVLNQHGVEAVSHLNVVPKEIEELLAAGLKDEHAWTLVRNHASRTFGRQELPPTLRMHLVERGPMDLVFKLELSSEETGMLLPRYAELSHDEQELARKALSSAIQKVELGREELLLVLKALEPEQLLSWLSRSRINRPDLSMMQDLLAELPEDYAERLRQLLSTAASQWGNDAWAAMAADLVPMEWGNVTNTTILNRVHERLTEEFGSDTERWNMALTLMDGWQGTLSGLIATVNNLQ